ncbi:MAG: 2-hydroxyacid dehydrogenase [Myxococcota bacterium]
MAFFDTKRYDRSSFEAEAPDSLAFSFLEPKLSTATAPLAAGHAIVCAFVNDQLDADTLRLLAGQGVRLIALRCAGTNNVDLPTARALGMDVARVPAYSPHAVAEHALTLVLTLNRKVHRAHQRVREGNFSLAGLEGFDLHGRTGGIVGTGQIGRCFAEILRGLGMEVLAFDPFPNEAFAERVGVRYVELDAIWARSDVVSLHAPLTPQTHHLVDRKAIESMKPGAMLINTSRGGLVDTEALVEGLKSGQIGSAGLDVYEEESEYFFEDRSDQVITDDVLARLLVFNNVIITSHQAFLTREALANIAATTIQNMKEWLDGRRGSELSNVVEPN